MYRLSTFSGSKKKGSIPQVVRWEMPGRIYSYAKKHFKGKFTHIDLRFRGDFCYIDAYCDPAVRSEELPHSETREYRKFIKQHQDKVIPMCRLRYIGKSDHWEFDFFACSSEKYEPCVFRDGRHTGPPEEAFHLAANIYLQ